MDNEMKGLYQELNKCVQSGNISGARAKFDTIFLFYANEIEFIDNCVKLCSSLEGFFEEFDNGELIKDPSLWTQEYLEDLQSSIPGNYSLERISLLIEINKYIKTILEGKRQRYTNVSKEGSSYNTHTNIAKESRDSKGIFNFIVKDNKNIEEEEVDVPNICSIPKKKNVNFQKATVVTILLSGAIIGLSLLLKKK